MRTMTRNRRVFYYASLDGVSMGTDKDGNYTEAKHTYTDPVKAYGVFSTASGFATMQIFGMDEHYDKTVMLNQDETFLKVGSVLWVDTMPTLDAQGKTTTPYDYIVVRVSNSLNFNVAGIRKVTVS